MTPDDAATLAQGATEKRCRICGNAHWRAPAGWIADHTSEPVDMPVKPTVEQAEADLAAALAILSALVGQLEHGTAKGYYIKRMQEARAFLAAQRERGTA